MDLAQVVALVRSHAWLALAILVVGFLVRLTAKDSKFPLFRVVNIPDQWQPVIVLALGTLADVLQELYAGKPWEQAVNASLIIGVAVLALKAYFHGREPGWLKALAMVVPTKTTVQEVTGPGAVMVPGGALAKVEITEPEPPKEPS